MSAINTDTDTDTSTRSLGRPKKRPRYNFYFPRDSESESSSEDEVISLPEWPIKAKTKTSTNRKREEELRFQLLPLLKEVNAHKKDEHIKFQDEGHKYWIRGSDDGVTSTTTLIKQYFEEFDPDPIIGRIIRLGNRSYWDDPDYQYYRKDAKQIRQMWAELGRKAAEDGTYNHEQIERYYNGLPADFSKREHAELFNQFYLDHVTSLEPFRTEMLLYHEELKITGSADMLYRNRRSGKIVLADWKFIKKLTKKRKSKQAKPPLDHLDDTNYTKYALQLSVYRYILETEYKYEVETQFLVILHKNQKTYKKEVTPYLRAEVEKMFELRRKSINLKAKQETKH